MMVAALAQKDEKGSPRVFVYRQLDMAEYLYLRGKSDQALFFVEKAEKKARKFEFLEELEAVLEWKFKIHSSREDHLAMAETLAEMDWLEKALAELRVCKRFFLQILSGASLTAGMQQVFEGPQPCTVRATLYHWLLEAKTCQQEGRTETLQSVLGQAVHLCERNTEIRLSNPTLVIHLYVQYLDALLAEGNGVAFDRTLDEFSRLHFLSEGNNALVAQRRAMMEWKGHLALGRPRPEPSHPAQNQVLTDWHLSCILSQLMAGNPKAALEDFERCHALLRKRGVDGKLLAPLLLLEMLIHLALDNGELIPFKTQALQKRIRRKGQAVHWTMGIAQILAEFVRHPEKSPVEYRQAMALLDREIQKNWLREDFYLLSDIRLWMASFSGSTRKDAG
jgi:hypothetical protein